MSQFPRYESYNDSGVQWLGEIPSHWAMKKLKYLTTYFKGFAFKSEDFSDIGIPLIKASNIKRFSIEKIDTYIALDKIQSSFDRVKLQEGDLILSTVGSLPNVLNSAVGQIAYIENSFNNSYLNQNNVCFRCNDLVVHAFLKYFVMSSFFRRSLDSHALWIANQAYLEIIDIQNINVAFPPINEQKIIANFLDKRLGQIDELIVKQEELLKKLAEQRIALISHAVTKGLDPNVEMKDSGVEWLGKVPKHWSVIKNKFIFNFSKGLTITKANLVDEGVPCVSYGEVHSKFGFEVNPDKHELKCVPEIYLESDQNSLLKYGDFIFADTSEDIKGSGNFTYLNSDVDTFAGYHTVIAKMNQNNNPRFMAYIFDTEEHRNQVRALVKGVKVFSITQAILKNTFSWMPSVEEQNQIVSYLDTEVKKYQQIGESYQLVIDRLKEYRSTLITQVVTGKIDVRNIDVN